MDLRDRIVSEIKRIAADCGRVPGVRAFEVESGIHRREWQGKIWARWSDALMEAGLEPNSLTARMDSSEIVEQVGVACLKFDRLPTTNDLRLYARSHPTFPAITTVENHFPRRALLIDALRELSSGNQRFAAIAAMLPVHQAVTRIEDKENNDGYVYLLRSGEHYKVGRSAELERRIKQITVALPEATILEHSIRTDDPSGIEAYWHRRFADKRANGEWFSLSKSDVLAFKRRKYQ